MATSNIIGWLPIIGSIFLVVVVFSWVIGFVYIIEKLKESQNTPKESK